MHRAMLSKCFLDIFFYFSSRFKTNQRENIPWNHHVSTPLRRFPLNFIYCVSSSPTSVCPQVQIESTPKQLCICSLIHWTNIYWEPSICKYLVHITMSKRMSLSSKSLHFQKGTETKSKYTTIQLLMVIILWENNTGNKRKMTGQRT